MSTKFQQKVAENQMMIADDELVVILARASSETLKFSAK